MAMKDIFVVPDDGSLAPRIFSEGSKISLPLTSGKTLILDLPTADAAEDLKLQFSEIVGTPLLKKVRAFEGGGKYTRLSLVFGTTSCTTYFDSDGVSPDSITFAFVDAPAAPVTRMKRPAGSQAAYA
jgi:hypothetical protein